MVVMFNPNYLTGTTPKVNRLIVFATGPGDWGLIPGRVIPKTFKKMILDTSFLNTQYYKVHIKGKVEQSSERSSAFLIPRCSSYWKRRFWVTLDYSRKFYLLTPKVNAILRLMFELLNFNTGWNDKIVI